jgi:single-strand DNA-binding protein
MNSVSVIGRLTRDPELKSTASGESVCNMRLAISGAGGKKDGELQAGFFDVEVWREQGERCAQYLTKGREIGVSGSLRWREWETKDGAKRQAVTINAFRVDFIGPKPDGPVAPAVADDDIPF